MRSYFTNSQENMQVKNGEQQTEDRIAAPGFNTEKTMKIAMIDAVTTGELTRFLHKTFSENLRLRPGSRLSADLVLSIPYQSCAEESVQRRFIGKGPEKALGTDKKVPRRKVWPGIIDPEFAAF